MSEQSKWNADDVFAALLKQVAHTHVGIFDRPPRLRPLRRKAGARRDKEALSSTPHLSQLAERVRTDTSPYLRSDVRNRVHELREQLTPEEQMLLVLRVDRDLPWADVARVMSDDAAIDADPAKAVATCRKKFERTTAKLRRFAEERGFLSEL